MNKSLFGFLRRSAGLASAAACLVLLMPVLPSLAQFPNPAEPAPVTAEKREMRRAVSDLDQVFPAGDSDPAISELRMRQLNAALHKSMVADTDKLVKLAIELNAEIASTNPSSLTSEQLRKVAEIEKLARSVKDKMKTTVQGTPVYLDATPLPPPSSRRR